MPCARIGLMMGNMPGGYRERWVDAKTQGCRFNNLISRAPDSPRPRRFEDWTDYSGPVHGVERTVWTGSPKNRQYISEYNGRILSSNTLHVR